MHQAARHLGTVLIVDDEPIIRAVAADILEDEGFSVLEAANADEALEIAALHSEVSLLFSDINMPGSMDGIGLATEVFRRWPSVEILIASGRERPSDASLPDHGTFIAKPYSMAELIAAVRGKLSD